MSEADFISIAAAREAPGLRLVSARHIPSPWTEAAKGIFHVKRLRFARVARSPDEPEDALAEWAGGGSGVPVVAYEHERLRTGWAEILLLAERLAPDPALVPTTAPDRALCFGLAHEICGEMGLGWACRLLMIDRGLSRGEGEGAFSPRVARYLAPRYGFEPAAVDAAKRRVIDVLTMLSSRIASRPYLMGETLTAVDIYWATFANLLIPLPPEDMAANPSIRAAFTCRDEQMLGAISRRLRAHQRDVYENHLELPVLL
jgi:glutathione S-transferase